MPHGPIGVSAGLLRGHGPKGRRIAAAKGPTRSREQELSHPPGGLACDVARRHALEQRIVLAINGKQGAPATADRLHKQRPRHHQGFLIRQKHPLSRLCGCQGGGQPGCPDDRRHNLVHLRGFGHGHEGLGPHQEFRRETLRLKCHREGLRLGRIHQHGVARTKAPALI